MSKPIRPSNAELFPEEVAAGVTDAEINHCSKAIGKLADEQGLVVVAAELVRLLIRERAAARLQGILHALDYEDPIAAAILAERERSESYRNKGAP